MIKWKNRSLLGKRTNKASNHFMELLRNADDRPGLITEKGQQPLFARVVTELQFSARIWSAKNAGEGLSVCVSGEHHGPIDLLFAIPKRLPQKEERILRAVEHIVGNVDPVVVYRAHVVLHRGIKEKTRPRDPGDVHKKVLMNNWFGICLTGLVTKNTGLQHHAVIRYYQNRVDREEKSRGLIACQFPAV